MRGLRLCLLLSAIAVPAGAADPESDALSQCFDRQVAKTPFSGIVAASNGRIRFERVSGFVDAESRTPPTADVPFRLASVQKVLTAVAIGQLVDQGKLALDVPIGRYLPGLGVDVAQVTIDQLLHHQAGIASLTTFHTQAGDPARSGNANHELAVQALAQPLAFVPGSKTEYSNGGYYVLGELIEKASGQAYGDYVKSHILAPLKMVHSGVVSGPDAAIPFSRLSPTGPLEVPKALPGAAKRPATAAGDGVSSANDMLLLGRALLGDALISRSVKERIFPKRSNIWKIGQSGGAPGENTDFSAYPDNGWVVVVLSNYDPPGGELMGEVMRKAAIGMPCEPLGAQDRPSPFQIILRPPPRPS